MKADIVCYIYRLVVLDKNRQINILLMALRQSISMSPNRGVGGWESDVRSVRDCGREHSCRGSNIVVRGVIMFHATILGIQHVFCSITCFLCCKLFTNYTGKLERHPMMYFYALYRNWICAINFFLYFVRFRWRCAQKENHYNG
jgi:hypothetical protein